MKNIFLSDLTKILFIFINEDGMMNQTQNNLSNNMKLDLIKMIITMQLLNNW